MHFVDTAKYLTEDIKNYLKTKEAAYQTQINEYNSGIRDKKPKPRGWANKIIQEPLSKCFKENCGYCGVRVLYNSEENEGDIDHFNPKSIIQSDIFNWSNYVWSCKVCNQQKKKDYYDSSLMIFDPTVKADCDLLDYNEGRYYVKVIKDKINFTKQQRRLEITEKHTRLNSHSNREKRVILFNTLKTLIESLIKHKQYKDIGLKNEYQNKREEFKKFCQHNSYKFLIIEVFFPRLKKIKGANILDDDVFQF